MHVSHNRVRLLCTAVVAVGFVGCGSPAEPGGRQIASIIVSQRLVTLHPGARWPLSATALDNKGEPISAGIQWSSRAPDIASVSDTGEVLVISIGQTYVIAAAGGKQDSAFVIVTQAPLLDVVSLSPQTVNLAVGQIVEFVATTPASSAPLNWSTSDPNVVLLGTSNSHEQEGLLTVRISVRGLAPGTATVTATAHTGRYATASVTVRQ